MNIIIPVGGKGERFSKQGYVLPKPIIRIFEKCMIEYVFDNLVMTADDRVFVIYNDALDKHHFSHALSKYPFMQLISINVDTKGATETLYLGLQKIVDISPPHRKCLILDCDTFYTEDIVSAFRESNCNTVFYTKNTDPAPVYSYIELDNEDRIVAIREKVKISDNANTGAYAFTDIDVLLKYCKHVLDAGVTFNGEPYTSCVISEMLNSGIEFKGRLLPSDSAFSLGTPEAVEQYIERTRAFLFDLDGTLVLTDEIYYGVWREILANYNIELTDSIFREYVQGNNDKYVLNTLLVNLDISLNALSHWKDELFLKNIHKLKIVPGVREAFQQIRRAGHKAAIVTNCNRRVADAIVNHVGTGQFVDFIVSADDCPNGKMTSEPYRKAIERYNVQSNRCIIFEDSKTGILSAKGAAPKCLVGVRTIYREDELKKYGVDCSISDFGNFNIDTYFLQEPASEPSANHFLINAIKRLPSSSVKNVHIDKAKLKGGFIADVIAVAIETTDNRTINAVVKCEAEQENNLALMAKRLELYSREYYFYTTISSSIEIRTPKFYYLLKDARDNTMGIVLENLLLREGFQLNLNLNAASIDVVLKIVDRMAKIHCQFWGQPLKTRFPALHKYSDELFCPFFSEFVLERANAFKLRWYKTLNASQQNICEEIFGQFAEIQLRFSDGDNLTFIHGDIKSPNIFYDMQNGGEPWFIDWQHCCIGKGVQDLAFFIIESFDIANVRPIFQLAKQYYYRKLVEYGVTKYSQAEYERDLDDALRFIPFFTAVWFGTTSQDELIDKNFPYFLITKLFYLLDE